MQIKRGLAFTIIRAVAQAASLQQKVIDWFDKNNELSSSFKNTIFY